MTNGFNMLPMYFNTSTPFLATGYQPSKFVLTDFFLQDLVEMVHKLKCNICMYVCLVYCYVIFVAIINY